MNPGRSPPAMAEAWVWALLSVVAVSLVSLVGAATLAVGALRRHFVSLALVALAAGTLMGDAFLHLLPEAAHAWEERMTVLGALVLVGFLLLFVLEVGLRWGHSHADHLDAAHGHGEHRIQPFGWLNLVGDFVHNLIDGIVIAASYLVSVPLGIATTIAVAAHEIPQELGDFAVLVRSGMRPRQAILLNLASALASVLGGVLVLVAGISPERLEAVAVPVIAGAFLYIAAADLVPELHHHSRGREALFILAFFLVGILAMAALLLLEPAGAH